MSDVTHAKCDACASYQPVKWQRIHVEAVHTNGHIDVFDGMEAICRRCDFKIGAFGTVSNRELAE